MLRVVWHDTCQSQTTAHASASWRDILDNCQPLAPQLACFIGQRLICQTSTAKKTPLEKFRAYRVLCSSFIALFGHMPLLGGSCWGLLLSLRHRNLTYGYMQKMYSGGKQFIWKRKDCLRNFLVLTSILLSSIWKHDYILDISTEVGRSKNFREEENVV